MKTILISLLIFFTVNAQNIWYVNRDASGSANGTSWTNAWKSLANVNWSSLSPGDTIYVSGGSDSTTYVPNEIYGIRVGNTSSNSPSWTFASGNPVVICPSWEAGHSGDVYFATSNDNQQMILRWGSISNVKITGFTFVDRRINPPVSNSLISFGNSDWGDMDSLIFFVNNHVIGNGNQGFLYLNGSKITIDNCYLEQVENSKSNDQDPFGISGGRGGHTISNNTIIMRNDNVGTDAHRDGIQFSNFGFGEGLSGWYAQERLPISIYNNLLIDTKADGTSWNSMIYSSGPYCNAIFYIYNNILVSQKTNTSISNIWIGHGNASPFNSYSQSVHILNNTIITKGGGAGPNSSDVVTSYNNDTLIVKNNLFVMDTTMSKLLNLDGSDGFPYCYKVFDYNHYGYYGGTLPSIFAVDNGVNINWTNWRQSPYNDDVHSTYGNSTAITFTNKYGINKADYYTTTGRDAGTNLWNDYPFLRYDILGNPRPQTDSWDIGALEFQSSGQSNNINLMSKLFLQGPFNSNSMSANLSQNGLLPNTQPFNTAPWNYNGSESLSSGASSNYVDWVLVELRNGSNPTQVIARKAAVLKIDGTLLNSDGTTGVPFSNVQEGSYYVAVFHRNHLSVMSAAPVLLSANSSVYDFSTGMNKAFGTNPMADLGNGVFGMYAGDGNSNGGITITDRNEVWLPQNGTLGYLNGDFNLDGGVTIHDVNLYWNINNGTMTQVP